jgi:hypothetical protein
MKRRDIAAQKAFNQEAARLHALIDPDAVQAIDEARALSSDEPTGGLKAGVLIDAGACANDKQAVVEGVALLRGLSASRPNEPSYQNRGHEAAPRKPKSC